MKKRCIVLWLLCTYLCLLTACSGEQQEDAVTFALPYKGNTLTDKDTRYVAWLEASIGQPIELVFAGELHG